MVKNSKIFLLIILFSSNLYSQEWEFTEPDDNIIKSIVSISSENLKDGSKYIENVTGVVIEKTDKIYKNDGNFVIGKILTCNHFSKDNVTVSFFNGLKSKAYVDKIDVENDLAVLDCCIPKDCYCVEVSDSDNPSGIVYGLGRMGDVIPSKINIRSFIGKRIGPKTDIYFLDALTIPGDSGGPIFYENKLVGIVSGGWMWFKNGSFTWPLRTATNKTIRNLLNE